MSTLERVTEGRKRRRKHAAVVLGFCRDHAGELALVLVERTARGRHAGQLALPGGNLKGSDADLAAAAVRETCEELGIAADQVTILEQLPAVDTATTGYRVWPFAARLKPGAKQRWHPQADEVAAVIEMPLRQLAAAEALGEDEFEFPGWQAPRTMPTRTVDGHVVWGLTLRLIEAYLPDALAGRWPV